MSNNDFYMILPSNASPATNPDNHPSDYIVTWENSIDLDPNYNWTVALTELSYIYSTNTIAMQYGIKYKRITEKFDLANGFTVDVVYDTQQKDIKTQISGIAPYEERTFYCIVNYDEQFEMHSNTPFTYYPDDDTYEKLGFDDYTPKDAVYLHDLGEWVIKAETALTYLYPYYEEEEEEEQITSIEINDLNLKWKYLEEKEDYIFFKTIKKVITTKDLVEFISKECKDIFDTMETVGYDESLRVHFIAKQDIFEVSLLNGLHFVLGFNDMTYHKETSEILYESAKFNQIEQTGDYIPQMNRGNTNMFIYASICKPIHVGHSLVPLLKNIHIDISNDFQLGSSRNYTVINPMYVPVASTSFNSIEINIRNDVGALLTFPSGSITTITVHFKKV